MATSPLGSPVGLNMASLLAMGGKPDIATRQLEIQRQQALAQQLKDEGSQQQDPAQLANPGGFVVPVNKWGALAKALEKGVGGYMQGQADRKQLDMYQAMAGNQNQSQPDVMGAATNAAIGSGEGPATADDVAGKYRQIAQSLQAQPPGQGAVPSVMGNPFIDQMYAQGNPEYFKFLAGVKAAQLAQPDSVKTARFAADNNDASAAQLLAAELRNKAIHEDRAGSASTDMVTGKKTFNPVVAPGAQPQYDADGNTVAMSAVPIVQPGQAAQAAPQPAPPNAPVSTLPPALRQGMVNQDAGNVAAQTASDMPPNANPMLANLVRAESAGNPDAVSPAGAGGLTQIMPATAADPGYGVKPLQNWDGKNPATAPAQEQLRFGNDYVNAMQEKFKDPRLAAAAYNAGPGKVDAVLKKLPAETQAYVPKVAGGQSLPPDFPPPSPPSQMTITPADTAGATKNAEATMQRHNDVLTTAASSPTRITDLQKIYDLAQSPTKFGPGAGKAAYWKAVSQQIPGISPDLADSENYEVAKKYFSNLSGQYQKALGGTGTDKQLEIAMSGTPGPDMLNKAITKVAPMLMAQEKALQAQATLRRAVTNPANGYGKNTVQDLQNMEEYWQKHYDPEAFELASIPPARRAEYINSLDPDKAKSLITSYQKAKEAGWLN